MSLTVTAVPSGASSLTLRSFSPLIARTRTDTLGLRRRLGPPRSSVRSAPAWPRRSFGMRVSRRGRLRRIQRTRLQINRKAWWGGSQSRRRRSSTTPRRTPLICQTIPKQKRHIHTASLAICPSDRHGIIPLGWTSSQSS